MKSLLFSFFLLIALIVACYFLSTKNEPPVERTDSTDVSEKQVTVAEPAAAEVTPVKDGILPITPDSPVPVIPVPPSEKPGVTEQKEPTEIPKPAASNKQTEPSGYYAAIANVTDDQLKAGLHQIIRGHRALTYGELWEALRDLDRGDEGNVILIYDRTQRSHSKNGGDQGDWNREHLWPRGYGVRRSSSANTDLHHIRASDVQINGKRGHLYFDETEGDDFSGKRYSSDMDSWEPPNMVKGDIARALFYMAVRYEGKEAGSIDLELSDTPSMETGVHGKLSVLLKWHKNDPVSDVEKARNNKIHRSYQGNRNPFIDHPEWAERIFQ